MRDYMVLMKELRSASSPLPRMVRSYQEHSSEDWLPSSYFLAAEVLRIAFTLPLKETRDLGRGGRGGAYGNEADT